MGGENLRARRIEKQALASLDTETRWRDQGGACEQGGEANKGKRKGEDASARDGLRLLHSGSACRS